MKISYPLANTIVGLFRIYTMAESALDASRLQVWALRYYMFKRGGYIVGRAQT